MSDHQTWLGPDELSDKLYIESLEYDLDADMMDEPFIEIVIENGRFEFRAEWFRYIEESTGYLQ